MTHREARVPGWPEYLAKLKEEGIWNKPELREQAIADWRALCAEQDAQDEAPVIADLKAAGIDVRSVWEMVNSRASFAEALPIVLKHLGKPYPRGVREGLARAMAEPAARFAWRELKAMYEREEDWQVKDALAVALANSAGKEEYDDLVDLVRDRSHGSSRALSMSALDRSKEPRALAEIKSLENDTEVRPTVLDILKKHSRRKRARDDG